MCYSTDDDNHSAWHPRLEMRLINKQWVRRESIGFYYGRRLLSGARRLSVTRTEVKNEPIPLCTVLLFSNPSLFAWKSKGPCGVTGFTYSGNCSFFINSCCGLNVAPDECLSRVQSLYSSAYFFPWLLKKKVVGGGIKPSSTIGSSLTAY